MAKAFASQSDMTEKTISFTEVENGIYAFTAEGDPNSGVIISDDSVMIIEAQATPAPGPKSHRLRALCHRQANQPSSADPLSRGASAGRLGLWCRANHHGGCGPRYGNRTWPRGLGQ